MTKDSEYDIDLDTGRIHMYDDSNTSYNYYPNKIPNRVRFTYIYGCETIYDEINQLILLMSSRELMKRMVRKALIVGQNDFKASLLTVDDEEINDILKDYIFGMSSNT